MVKVVTIYQFIRKKLDDNNRSEVDAFTLCQMLNEAIATVGDELVSAQSPDVLTDYVVLKIDGDFKLPEDFAKLAERIDARVVGRFLFPYDSSVTAVPITYYKRPYAVSEETIAKDEPMPFADDALCYKAGNLAYINAMSMMEENISQDMGLFSSEAGVSAAANSRS